MNGEKKYIRYTWFLVVMVFLVILAGGVVRMTQSGMGCPDWPRCFGRWVPPTSASQLPPDFEKYLGKQDIDHTFNAYHTWIEYINRLLGALLGFFIIIHVAWSFLRYRKTKPQLFYLSFFLLITTGFQGWLGKRVVDANLANVKVTTHMLVALLIAAIPLVIIYKLKSKAKIADRLIKNTAIVVLLIVLVQIVLGTQVREQIDEISKSLQYSNRDLWVSRLDQLFLIHRSFSWLVAAGGIFLYWKARSYEELRGVSLLILFTVMLTMALGVIMMRWSVPALAQPMHLLFASILAMALFTLRLRLK